MVPTRRQEWAGQAAGGLHGKSVDGRHGRLLEASVTGEGGKELMDEGLEVGLRVLGLPRCRSTRRRRWRSPEEMEVAGGERSTGWQPDVGVDLFGSSGGWPSNVVVTADEPFFLLT
jgi:hypothetical protein